MIKSIFKLSIMTSCLFLIGARGCAEGGQNFSEEAHGVNRVVRVNPGYVGIRSNVSISYTIPSAHLMPPVPESSNQLVSETPRFIRHSTNPFDNKPSAYFGGNVVVPAQPVPHTHEVDAGLQLETNNYAFNNIDVHYPGIEGGGERLGRAYGGWAAFISHNNVFTNPQIWDPDEQASVAWRPSHTIVEADVDLEHEGDEKMAAGSSSITAQLEFRVTLPNDPAGARGAALNVHGLGTFYWNNDPQERFANDSHPLAPSIAQPVFPGNQLNNIDVKRVAAMTRRRIAQTGARTRHQLDGSHMEVNFSDVEVRQFDQTWVNLSSDNILQNTTGYDAPDNNAGDAAWDSRWAYDGDASGAVVGQSRTIIEFIRPGTGHSEEELTGYNHDARENLDYAGLPQDSPLRSRYNNERIRINLRTVTRPIGSSVVIPGR